MIRLLTFFKCLSDETRLNATLLIHQEGELCVCDLMDALGESQPKISRHLAQLRKCDLLTDTRRGQWVYYSVNQDLPAWATDLLDQACAAHATVLRQHLEALDKTSGTARCC